MKFGTKSQNLLATIINLSNIEIGMRIVFETDSKVVNPSLVNILTGESIKISETIEIGDIIEVTTYINEKNIYITKNGGNKIRKNNSFVFGSKFLQLHNGTNTFKAEADEGAEHLILSIFYYNNYEAV